VGAKSLPQRPVIWGRDLGGALRLGPWKLVNEKLYNLEEDPQEKQNLASRHPGRVKRMMQQRDALFAGAMLESPYD